MKKLILSLAALMMAGFAFGQPLTGIKNIPGDFSSIAAAIQTLDTQGVGNGGVTFMIAAGYTETFINPADGYITTSTGSASNPIVFMKSGTGNNPKITAAAGLGVQDAIICFSGTNHVTFDGIDLYENPLNTTPVTRMEWGFALLKASGTQGSQNITIQNCHISLAQGDHLTYGIYSANHTISSPAPLTVTSTGGQNSYNRFYGNTITGCYGGIFLAGYNDGTTPFTYYDQNNDIGSVNGNTITSFGGGSSTVYVIYAGFQNNLTIANSSITGGNGTTGDLYGIYGATAFNANANIYGNVITLNSSSATSSLNGIFNQGTGSFGSSNTLNIYNNTIQNCEFTSATTGLYYAVCNVATTSVINFYGNTVSGNKIGGTAYTDIIRLAGGPGTTFNVYNNTVSGNKKIITGGVISTASYTTCLRVAGQGIVSVHDNIIQNDTLFMNATLNHCGLYGLYATNIAPNSILNMDHNSVHDLFISSPQGTNSRIDGIDYTPYGTGASGVMNYNSVYNLKIVQAGTGTADIYGMNEQYCTEFSHNDVYNCTISGPDPGLGGIIYGEFTNNGTSPCSIHHNKVYGLSASGGFADIRGLSGDGGPISPSVFHNNLVYDLNSPNSDGLIIGVYLISSGPVQFYYNTIYLNASSTSTTTFETTGLVSFNGNFDMRNNLIINTSSAPASTTYRTVAFRRAGTSLNTYDLTSNYNDFYAGTPSPNHLIYYDLTNGYQTLQSFLTLISPRESLSFSENPPFVNTTMSPYDLHLKTTVPTRCESGGTIISSPSITVDYDNDPRYPNAGYPGTSAAPDVGADEMAGIPGCPLPAAAGPISGPDTVCQSASGYVYTVSPIVNATGYLWTVPPGATITSGAGTNSITVAFDATASTGTLSVTGTSVCGNGAPSPMGITVMGLNYPTITGSGNMCINSGYYIYTTEPGKTNYNWNIQGGTINYGQGTDSVWVSWTISGAQWISVSYTGVTGCFASTPTIYNVMVDSVPDPAGVVTGIQELCGGETGVPYSTTPINGATAYVWSLPTGAGIATGFGTNNITVDFAPDASSGDIIVYGNNICGNGASSALPINVHPLPPAPVVTPYTGYSLMSNAPAGNQWYYSTTINGTASPIPGATGQIFDPYTCGTGCGYYWTMVTLEGCSSDTSNHLYVCIEGIRDPASDGISITPVPNDGHFMVNLPASMHSPLELTVVSSLGVRIMSKSISEINTKQSIDIRPVPRGVYFVRIDDGSRPVVRRIVVE